MKSFSMLCWPLFISGWEAGHIAGSAGTGTKYHYSMYIPLDGWLHHGTERAGKVAVSITEKVYIICF